MKLLVEAFPAQPYVFKLILANDDVRRLGTAWAEDFYTKLEEYSQGYPFTEIILYGPRTFAEPLSVDIRNSDVLDYSTAKTVKFIEAGV